MSAFRQCGTPGPWIFQRSSREFRGPFSKKIRTSPGGLPARFGAGAEEDAGVLKNQGHGLFTYDFLKGLNKGAVHRGRVTIAGLSRYLDRRVTDKANLDNRSQTPLAQPGLSSDGSVRLR